MSVPNHVSNDSNTASSKLNDELQSARAGEDSAEEKYESGLKPALWLLVPFILMLMYGALT